MLKSLEQYIIVTSSIFLIIVLRNRYKKLFDKTYEIYESFAASCNKILDNHATLKKKYVRGNHSSFMNKSFSKAILVRTRLRNNFLKNRSEENKINYNKQRSLVKENIIKI